MGSTWSKRMRCLTKQIGRWSATCILIGTVCLVRPVMSVALSISGIRAQAQQIENERARLLRAEHLAGEAEARLIERLGPLVLAFIDHSDRAARAGTERAERTRLRSVFEAVHTPLNGIYQRRANQLENMARKIMDADGDLEALYETAAFQEAQRAAARSLYFLDWLDYYGARLYEAKRRKELLAAAERGFSEFAVGDQAADLMTESLLGRALCHVELGHYDWAIRDLGMVISDPHTSPQRRTKANLALLDAYARAGKPKDVLRHTKELLGKKGFPKGDRTIIRFYRLQALLETLPMAPRKQADRYRREAGSLMNRLRRADKGWADKVETLMATDIDDPARWAGQVTTPAGKFKLAKLLFAKGDEDQAVPLLEDVAGDDGKAAHPYRAEANYMLGIARLKTGENPEAVQYFDAALREPAASFAAEAAYMRFKALEALMANEPTPALAGRYAAALRGFLARHADHKAAPEVRYRLGEYLQAQGDAAAAVEQYAAVAGDPGFELRARFGALQCEFSRFGEARRARERDAALTRIGAGLERFRQTAETVGQDVGPDVPLAEFKAKATVFHALYVLLTEPQGTDETLAVLAGFEQSYPEQSDLLPQVVRLRLRALLRGRRFAEAASETKRHITALRDEGRFEMLGKLAARFMKAGARTREENDTGGAGAAEHVALQLYEIVAAGGTTDDKMRLNLAHLYQSGGDVEQAEAQYRQVLENDATSLAALRGLAQVAERRGSHSAALGYWKRYTGVTRPGDRPWYEGNYQQARLTLARGDKDGCCRILDDLKPAMPGLSDADLRERLDTLYALACR